MNSERLFHYSRKKTLSGVIRRIIAFVLIYSMLGAQILTSSASAEAGDRSGGESTATSSNAASDRFSGGSSSAAGGSKADKLDTTVLSGTITFMDDGTGRLFEPDLRLYVNGEPDDAKVYISKTDAIYATDSDADKIPIYNDLENGEGRLEEARDATAVWMYWTDDLPETDEDGMPYIYSIRDVSNEKATSSNALEKWALYYTKEDGRLLGEEGEWTEDAANLIYVIRGAVKGFYRSEIETDRIANTVRLEISAADEDDMAYMGTAEGWLYTGTGTWTISDVLLYNPETGRPIAWRAQVIPESAEAYSFIYENTGKQEADTGYVYAGGTIINSSSTFAVEGTIAWEDGDNWHGERPMDASFIKIYNESGNDVTERMAIELLSKDDSNWHYRINGLLAGENYVLSQSLLYYQAAETAVSAGGDDGTVQVEDINEKLKTHTYSGTINWNSNHVTSAQPEELDFLEIYEGSKDITEHVSFSLTKSEQDTSVWYYKVEGLLTGGEYDLRVTVPEGYSSNLTEYAIRPVESNARTTGDTLPVIQFTRSVPVQIVITNDTQGLEAGASIAVSYKIMAGGSEYTGDYVLLDENGDEIPGSQSSGAEILVESGTMVRVQLVNASPGIEIDVVQNSPAQGLIALAKEQSGTEFTFRNSVLTGVEACIVWDDNNNYDGGRPYQNEQSYLAAGHLELYFSLDGGITYQSAEVNYEELGLEQRPEFSVLDSAGESSDWYFIVDGLPSHVYVDGKWVEVQYQVKVADNVEEPGYIISKPEYVTGGENGLWEIIYIKEVIFDAQIQWNDDDENNQVRPGIEEWKDTLIVWQIGKDGVPVPVETTGFIPNIEVEENQGDSSKWNLTISGLPEYDENGYPYTYYVVQGEVTPGGDNELLSQVDDLSYKTEYDNSGNFSTNTGGCYQGGTIINSLQGTLTFSMTKEWTDGDSADRPDVTLTLWRYVKGENYLAAVQVDLVSGLAIDKTQSPYVIEISDDLPAFDGDGHEYIYFIKEEMNDAGDYIKEVSNHSPLDDEHGADWLVFNEGILNNKLSATTEISGNKTWKAKSVQGMKATVTFELQRRKAGSADEWTTVEEKEVSGFRAEVMSQEFTFSTDKYDDDGIQYEYRIVETGVSVSYQGEAPETFVFPETSYDEEPYQYQIGDYTFERTTDPDGTIVNKLVGETAIEIDKYWSPYDGATEELHFHVFRNGEDTCICEELSELQGVSLEDDGQGGHLGILVMTPDEDFVSDDGTTQHWNHIFDGLPKYDDKGAAYTYTIAEDVPSGYSYYQEYSYGSTEGADYAHMIAKIYNIHGDGDRIIVIKNWLDDSDLLHREAVTVELFKDGISTGQTITLSAENGWWGSFSLEDETSASVDYSKYTVREIKIGESDDRQVSASGGLDYFSADHHIYEVEEVSSEGGTVWKIINRRIAEIHIDLTKTWVAGGEEADYTAIFEVLQNGESMVPERTETLTADAAGSFHAAFENLPKYDETGSIYQYTLREISANGLPVTDNKFVYGGITYQTSLELKEVVWGDDHDKDDVYYWKAVNKRIGTSDIVFHKIWKDLNNEKTSRPDIYLKLYRWVDKNADGVLDNDEQGSVELVEQLADWEWAGDYSDYHQTITYKGLPDYDESGYPYAYFAEEVVQAPNYQGIWQKAYFDDKPVPNGSYQGDYSSLIPLEENNGKIFMPEDGIAVNYKTNETFISGKKIWENMGVLKKEDYPEITISLYASFWDPVTEAYTAPQPVMDGNGNPITATIGIVDGSYVSTYKFDLLPQYDTITGAKIIYTVSEEMALENTDNFEMSGMDFGFKNTYKKDQNLSVEIEKTWDFGELLDLPDSLGGYPVIVFDLYRVIQKWNGTQYVDAGYPSVRVETKTLDRNNAQTSVIFEDLSYYAPNGRPYRYYVSERIEGSNSNGIPGYNTVYNDIVLSDPDAEGKITGTCEVTNTYTEEIVKIKGTKEWIGDTGWITENGDTFRPDEIEFELWRKTASMPAAEKLSDAVIAWENETTDTWSFTFESGDTEFYRYATNGEEYVYTVKEVVKPSTGNGYTYTVSSKKTEEEGTWTYNFSAKNTLQTTALKVHKNWDDSDNIYNTRPQAVTVKLQRKLESEPDTGYVDVLKNGSEWRQDLTLAGGWEISFTGLPRYKITWVSDAAELEKYVYRIVETDVPADYYAPDAYIVTESGNNWIVTFYNVLKADETIEITAQKVWEDDDDDQDGFRREVIFGLYRDGSPDPICTVTLDGVIDADEGVNGKEDTPWHVTWKNQPKWIDGDEANGASRYEVKELTWVDFYEKGEVTGSVEDGYIITNTRAPVDLIVTKVWEDQSNYYHTRPEELKLILEADPGLTAEQLSIVEIIGPSKSGDNWFYGYKNLPKYSSDGTKIQYSVKEEVPENYEVSYDIDYSNNKVTIKNTLNQVDFSGTKTWLDDDNRFSVRPDTIELLFKSNGVEMDPQPEILWTQNGNVWNWEAKGLPAKDAQGSELVYTVEESPVAGYHTSQAGMNITNQLRTGALAVTKIQDGGSERDFTFRVKLNINGTEIPYTGSYTVLGNEAAWNDPGEVRQTDESGAIVIRKDQQFVITGLPAGAAYVVTEDSAYHFTLISSTGNIGVIPYQTAADASFTNEYTYTGSGGSGSGSSSGGTSSTSTGTEPTESITLLGDEEVPFGEMPTTMEDDDIPLDGLARMGDNSLPYALLITIMLGAVGAITALVLKRRKEENE